MESPSNSSLNDWMKRHAPASMWGDGRAQEMFLSKNPYFEHDLFSAFQAQGVVGAKEVVEYYKNLRVESLEIVKSAIVENMGEYPRGVNPIRVDEERRIEAGYKRLIRKGLFESDKGPGVLCQWHKHEPTSAKEGIEFYLAKK